MKQTGATAILDGEAARVGQSVRLTRAEIPWQWPNHE
jgi:hypothetical protein